MRERYLNYFLITDGDTILMNKRGTGDIWANLYDMPMIETSEQLNPYEVLQLSQAIEYFGNDTKIIEVSGPLTHVLTHQRLKVNIIKLHSKKINLQREWFYTEVEKLNNLAMPQIIFIFLTNIFTFKNNFPFSN